MKKQPNPVDKAVGLKIRERRLVLGMSQEKLAAALSLTFQQVQKYEKGMNRVGASRLAQIATALGVSESYFFPDRDDKGVAITPHPGLEFLATREGAEIAQLFPLIESPEMRRAIMMMIAAAATAERKPIPPGISKKAAGEPVVNCSN